MRHALPLLLVPAALAFAAPALAGDRYSDVPMYVDHYNNEHVADLDSVLKHPGRRLVVYHHYHDPLPAVRVVPVVVAEPVVPVRVIVREPAPVAHASMHLRGSITVSETVEPVHAAPAFGAGRPYYDEVADPFDHRPYD